MTDLPTQILCEIINHHGTALCSDINRFEELLHDMCSGEYRREVFLLVSALKEGVVTDLLNSPKDITLDALYARLTKRLYDNLGFDKVLIEWAVQSWHLALQATENPINTLQAVDFGMMYFKLPDYREAAKWFRMAANQKEAQYYLGLIYKNEATKWLRRALEQGYLEAQNELMSEETPAQNQQTNVALRGHEGEVYIIAYSPNGEVLASGGSDMHINLWKLNSGLIFGSLEGHQDKVYCVCFNPDGTYLASGSHDNSVKLWEIKTGKLVRTLQGHQKNIASVAFTPDGKTLASASHDKTIKMWKVSTGKLLHTLEKHRDWVFSVAFNPKGDLLASGSFDKTIILWKAGKIISTLQGHKNFVSAVAFSPDGHFLASASYDKTIKLWKVKTGKLLKTLEGHEKSIISLAFSPDGVFLASGSFDKTIKLWSVDTGKSLQTVHGHQGHVNAVAFSPDGSQLASASNDETIQLWTINQNYQAPEQTPIDALEFTEDFLKAYDLMENNTECVFITGKAGTGKSTLLQHFKRNSRKKMVVLAPTGIAALNVGGSTLHSFFKLPPRPINRSEIKTLSRKMRKLYQSVDTIVIDEISMVRADMMDIIDRFMRLNGKHRHKPFGGTQMIFIGDLFQLPPVVSNDEEAKLFSSTYDSPFFFSAKVFQEVELISVELTRVFRHKEQEFIRLLNSIRNNKATSKDIKRINQRYQPNFELEINDYYITLTTTNNTASEINTAQLEKLPTPLYQFEGEIKGKFDNETLPTESALYLKEGAQVMFVKNDSEGRWANGTLGRIKKIEQEQIQVETPDKMIYPVKRLKWEMLTYEFDEKTEIMATEVIGSFTQYPLKLAWAMTIHKSQGKQFDKVIIDLGWGTFAHGQLYVALSRCKTLEGLVLKSKVRPKDVIVDERVIEFFLESQSRVN